MTLIHNIVLQSHHTMPYLDPPDQEWDSLQAVRTFSPLIYHPLHWQLILPEAEISSSRNSAQWLQWSSWFLRCCVSPQPSTLPSFVTLWHPQIVIAPTGMEALELHWEDGGTFQEKQPLPVPSPPCCYCWEAKWLSWMVQSMTWALDRRNCGEVKTRESVKVQSE